MANSPSSRRTKKKSTGVEATAAVPPVALPLAVQAKIELPPSRELPTGIYANYVGINHTDFEVSLVFAQAGGPTTEAEGKAFSEDPTIVAKPVANILISHTMLPTLIEALRVRQTIIASAVEHRGEL